MVAHRGGPGSVGKALVREARKELSLGGGEGPFSGSPADLELQTGPCGGGREGAWQAAAQS